MVLERIGLIDIGSNTIRLVVFEVNEYFNIHELQNVKTPARLSQYLNEEKVMSQEGIDVLIRVLANLKQISDQYRVSKLMPKATAAIRQSQNVEDILRQVKEATGIEMEVVPEEMEAFYGHYAVVHTTQYTEGVTVDIGGGSTEVTYYQDKKIVYYKSFPFGVVTLKQMFFSGKEHNNEKAIKKTQDFVKEQFKSIKWLNKKQVPITAMGGSARSIAGVHQHQVNYPLAGVHGYHMQREDLQQTLTIFKNSSMDQLVDLDGLSEDRWDIIIPANIVFNALYDEVKATVFMFSNRGLREGILMEYLNKKYNNKAFALFTISSQTIYRLGLSYQANTSAADQRGLIMNMLYTELWQAGIFKYDAYLERMLQYGSYLYYLGNYIESGSGSQHTFYIITNSELNAITHQERVLIALLASYKNKSLFKQYMQPFQNWFTPQQVEQLQALGALIRFAEALNDSHLNVIRDLKLNKVKNGYELILYANGSTIAEEYRAERQRKHFERLLKGKLTITFRQLNDPQ